jgi:hypothetical protein
MGAIEARSQNHRPPIQNGLIHSLTLQICTLSTNFAVAP